LSNSIKTGRFLRGDGQPLRFWGVVSDNQKPIGEGSSSEPRNLAHHARWLAKRGVNIARTLVDITPRPREGWGAPNSDNPNDVNRKELDGVWRYVAGDEEEGIYSLICPYWALTVKPPASLGNLASLKAKTHTTRSSSIRKCVRFIRTGYASC
jgi:hypothetical protein